MDLLPIPAQVSQATQKEYSGELGSQNDPKMEPKMDIQKGSLHKNMKKSIWTTIYASKSALFCVSKAGAKKMPKVVEKVALLEAVDMAQVW